MARARVVRRDRLVPVSRGGVEEARRRAWMKPLESKLPTVGTTIFTVMTQLANEHGAVNLSQGFPNFEPPAGLIERVEHYLKTRCHQYAPMPGSAPLRAAIATKLADLYRVTASPDTEITITS